MGETYHYLIIRRLDYVVKKKFQWGLFQRRLTELGDDGYRLIDRFEESKQWVLLFSKTNRGFPVQQRR